jgi:hypothetical protein
MVAILPDKDCLYAVVMRDVDHANANTAYRVSRISPCAVMRDASHANGMRTSRISYIAISGISWLIGFCFWLLVQAVGFWLLDKPVQSAFEVLHEGPVACGKSPVSPVCVFFN